MPPSSQIVQRGSRNGPNESRSGPRGVLPLARRTSHRRHPRRARDRPRRSRAPRRCGRPSPARPAPGLATRPVGRHHRARPLGEHLVRHVQRGSATRCGSSSSTDGRYGLVVFSNVAYEALPPGSPASALRPLIRYFTVPTARRRPGAAAPLPTNPWTLSFSSGTRISAGLDLAHRILLANRLTRARRRPHQRPRRRPAGRAAPERGRDQPSTAAAGRRSRSSRSTRRLTTRPSSHESRTRRSPRRAPRRPAPRRLPSSPPSTLPTGLVAAIAATCVAPRRVRLWAARLRWSTSGGTA